MNEAKLKKRQQIEEEISSIVLRDRRAILINNMKIRQRRLGNLACGDTVLLAEPIGKRFKQDSFDDDFLYRIFRGRIVQVTRHGFFVEGKTRSGRSTTEFINKAHVINGTLRIFKEKI